MPYKVFIIFLSVLVLHSAGGYAETFEADNVPWSGYWWPFRYGGLITGKDYRGNPAPLEKYELYLRGAAAGPSVTWFRDRYYDPGALPWTGLCGSWARAAAYDHLEILPASIDNIIFRVGDKKGLLTIAHDQDLSERGDGSDPAQFHYWLLNYIRDRRKAFIADLDPGIEKWNYPIFKYDMTRISFGAKESIQVTIYYADDNVHPDYIGTVVQEETYTYDIYLDDQGRILRGEWTGRSVTMHPQQMFASILPDPGTDTIDYPTVLQIASTNDDFLENADQYAELSNGTYHLILLDPDRYWIPCRAGDRIRLTVQKVIGSRFAFEAVVKDADGKILNSGTVDKDLELNLFLESATPGLFLELSQTDYSDPNIYTVIVDRFTSASQSVPYVPKNGKWSGYALTNTGDDPVSGITVVSFDSNGRPIQSLKGPFTLAGNRKEAFFFEALPWRRHELQALDHILVLSDAPISVLNLVGDEKSQTLVAEVQGLASGSHLILPDTSSLFSLSNIMAGKLVNESPEPLQVVLTSYSNTGVTDRAVTVSIPSRGSVPLVSGQPPFYSLPDGGWIDIATVNGNPVSGFQTLSSYEKSEGIFAVTASDEKKIVPHIPDASSGWTTALTLINAADSENMLTLHSAKAGPDVSDDRVVRLAPREKIVVSIHALFGRAAGDPLFQSILEITGTEAFGGYYTYEKAAGADMASYCLMNIGECKTELVLQHCASNSGKWWTGIGLFNPGASAARVLASPYDQAGNLIASAVKTLHLMPGAKQVFFARDLFGLKVAPTVSFVRYVSETGSPVGGFYLYGKETSRMIGGANM